MELCSLLRASLNESGVWGRTDICISMDESLRYSLETITAVLISYTPIQNILVLKINNFFKDMRVYNLALWASLVAQW